MSEQTKRLQLLVKLGHKDIAAQGFSTGQKDMIRKAMRYVEASGDVEKFTSELSRVFFSHLREACTSFMDLFSTSGTKSDSLTSTDEEGDMASLSYLVGWIQEQMSVFVTALARQIQLGAAENRSKVFEQNVHTLRNYHQQKHNLLSQKVSLNYLYFMWPRRLEVDQEAQGCQEVLMIFSTTLLIKLVPPPSAQRKH